jgi:hypothetical protein
MLHFAAAGAGRARSTRRRAAPAAVAASLVVAGVLVGALLTAGAADAADPGQGRVVVVGVAGLRWADVSPEATPALWSLAQHAAIGTVAARSVRSSACPADGWLAISAGARAADAAGATEAECRTLSDPGLGAPVPGWSDYLAAVRDQSYDARLGTLGSALRASGVSASGFGPGAAIALADPAGALVGDHHPVPMDPAALRDELVAAMSSSRLVVIDGGVVRDGSGSPDSRAGAVAAIESRVAAVLAALDVARSSAGLDPTFLLVSLADSGTTPQLQLAAALGPPADAAAGRFDDALLAAASTRQPAMLQVTDIAPTIVTALGLPPDADGGAFVGAPIRADGSGGSTAERLDLVLDTARHASAAAPVVRPFFGWLFGLLGLLVVVVVAGLARRSFERPGALRALRIVGVAFAATPVASLLANAVPWWRSGRAGLALAALVLAGVAVIGALALLPRSRRRPLGPTTVVAAITTVVIAADVVAGAHLQVSAAMGVQPLVAGRFYGFNNSAFAMFAASSLLLAVALANPLVRNGRRGQAAALVGVIGLVATVLDGAPGIGSDFGGPTALFSAFAVLALLAAGIRLTWTRVLGVLLAGGAIVGVFAFVDWLRPAASRTHLGRFVQTAIDGGVWPVARRKLGQSLGPVFGSWTGLLALAAVILIVVGLWQAWRRSARAPDGGALTQLAGAEGAAALRTELPMLRPVVLALAIALGIGFLVNDSGIAIPAIGIAVALPLLLATCSTWLLGRPAR